MKCITPKKKKEMPSRIFSTHKMIFLKNLPIVNPLLDADKL
jgi:hypothetical protein